MKKMILSGAGISDAGIVKSVNEDNYFFNIATVENEMTGIFVVADGVGGLTNSEIASSMAVNGVAHWWKTEYRKVYFETIHKIHSSLLEVIETLNMDIFKMYETCGKRMATTISILILYKKEVYIFHIGDSRIYRIRTSNFSKIEQVTEDHSVEIEREKNGKLIKKNYLSECLGAKVEFKYFCSTSTMKKGDIFFLCSDGIYKTVSKDEIRKATKSSNEPQKICSGLIDLAKRNGEKDNITALVATITN